jgi:HEAT repeat protein
MRYAACVLAFMFSVVDPCLAQRLGKAPLEPGMAAVIERLYPGFEEVLESDDAPALGALARTLYANPSRESLSVLLWMLQFCPSWDADVSQLSRIVLSVGVLPVARIARVLSDGNADQRISAAVILSQVALVPPADRQHLQQTLITALSDSNALVREIAANSLRELNTADGNIALMKAAQDPDASDQLFWLATGRVRGPRSIPDASTFPATTVSAMRALDPNFLYTLGDLNLPGTSQILQALERSKDPDTTPVLLWLLLNASSHTWGPRIAGHLARPPHVNQLPIGELARQLGTVDSDHRAMIIELFDQLFRLKARPQDRETMVTGCSAV